MTAVTRAIPGVPGLQIAMVGSQVPAQALPLPAIESGAEALGVAAHHHEIESRRRGPTAAVGILAGGAKNLSGANVHGEGCGGVQGDGCHAAVAGVAAALAEAAGEGEDRKMMANVSRKTEPQRCMNPRVRFQGFRVEGSGTGVAHRGRYCEPRLCNLETLKPSLKCG